MTTFIVDEHHVFHSCPANLTPHVITIHRRIVDTVHTGRCLAPFSIEQADRIVTADCRRYAPFDDQCRNCRHVINVRTVTSEFRGWEGPENTRPDNIPADNTPTQCPASRDAE
ncbi:hypothetical protein Val02_13970 [Virgisporangium aliadipatigenens]|uniref:Uncharacterized protein n=1 Tax=Virgisporangium aliadipatigenens TaxID=741659 RepID=A0A8J3YIE1_9ACTN|nr:hypothetical protein [Virgisporangium aliadipatigenens]GIJ44511.1 hypothetical protein Val02_13970 [Virgisporangium aliadipatigenens]